MGFARRSLWLSLPVLSLFLATTIHAPAQTLTTLVLFDETDGANPSTPIQGTDGNFYGVTGSGGTTSPPYGTVFKMTPSGTLTTLHSFGGVDGAYPDVLIQAADGDFYGTTSSGGPSFAGTVFKITPSGTLTTLHSFSSTDGAGPVSLVQATDGNFYGTTFPGGTEARS